MDALVGIMIAVAGAVGIVLLAVAVAMIRSIAQTRHSQQVVPVHDVKVVAEDGRQYAHDPDAYRDWFFSRARTQVSQLAGGVRNDRPFVANMRAGHVVPDEALLCAKTCRTGAAVPRGGADTPSLPPPRAGTRCMMCRTRASWARAWTERWCAWSVARTASPSR